MRCAPTVVLRCAGFRYGFGRTVTHVRLEDWVTAGFDFGFGGFHQRDDPVIEFIAHGVVGVDCDAHPVVLGDFTGEGGKCQRPGDHVVNLGTGKVFCPTVGNLNDAVGFGFSKATKRGVERL